MKRFAEKLEVILDMNSCSYLYKFALQHPQTSTRLQRVLKRAMYHNIL